MARAEYSHWETSCSARFAMASAVSALPTIFTASPRPQDPDPVPRAKAAFPRPTPPGVCVEAAAADDGAFRDSIAFADGRTYPAAKVETAVTCDSSIDIVSEEVVG